MTGCRIRGSPLQPDMHLVDPLPLANHKSGLWDAEILEGGRDVVLLLESDKGEDLSLFLFFFFLSLRWRNVKDWHLTA